MNDISELSLVIKPEVTSPKGHLFFRVGTAKDAFADESATDRIGFFFVHGPEGVNAGFTECLSRCIAPPQYKG
jgi:hypothetical protein